jgi:hypothetical protein
MNRTLVPTTIMNLPASHCSIRLRILAAALASCLLLACGGVGSGGTGLGGVLAGGAGVGGGGGGSGTSSLGTRSALSEGTITGFGSVIVDGVLYDDSAVSAPYVTDYDEGQQPVALHLGQRVRLELDTSGKAIAIEVLPQLQGPVTAALGGGWLQVAGQWVRVGPKVFLPDHAQLLDIGTNSKDLEVHGVWGYDVQRGAVLEATLVRLRLPPANGDAATQPVLVGGVVQAVDGRNVTVGAVGGARFTLPEGSSVPPVGTLVSFWVDRAVLAQPQPWPVKGGRRPLVLADGTTMTLSGAISAIDGSGASVQGFKVAFPTGLGAQSAGLRLGELVQVTVRSVGGALELVKSEVRGPATAAGMPVSVRAVLSGTDWTQPQLVIRPRDVAVQIPASVLEASGCAAFGAAAVEVSVQAEPGPLPLTATELTCTQAP